MLRFHEKILEYNFWQEKWHKCKWTKNLKTYSGEGGQKSMDIFVESVQRPCHTGKHCLIRSLILPSSIKRFSCLQSGTRQFSFWKNLSMDSKISLSADPWYKDREAFRTLVESLVQMTTFISRIFLKIGHNFRKSKNR